MSYEYVHAIKCHCNHSFIHSFISDPGVKNLLLSPVVDGDFLPDQPGNLFHNAADIDYLAGVNNMDGHLFTAQDIPSLGNKNQETPV